jgi:hypothetical protein
MQTQADETAVEQTAVPEDEEEAALQIIKVLGCQSPRSGGMDSEFSEECLQDGLRILIILSCCVGYLALPEEDMQEKFKLPHSKVLC